VQFYFSILGLTVNIRYYFPLDGTAKRSRERVGCKPHGARPFRTIKVIVERQSLALA